MLLNAKALMVSQKIYSGMLVYTMHHAHWRSIDACRDFICLFETIAVEDEEDPSDIRCHPGCCHHDAGRVRIHWKERRASWKERIPLWKERRTSWKEGTVSCRKERRAFRKEIRAMKKERRTFLITTSYLSFTMIVNFMFGHWSYFA